MNTTQSMDLLNTTYAIDGNIVFTEGKGGLICARIENSACTAEVYLHGAHVTSYVPKGGQPVLWLAPNSGFRPNHPIRGGIPVCWPWFGKHPHDMAKPFHGFARLQTWTVTGTRQVDPGTTEIYLLLTENKQTLSIWPHRFDLTLKITAGTALGLELTGRNTGNSPITVTQALHSYLTVGDSANISISGLDKTEYYDKVDGSNKKTQSGDVTIAAETDRAYVSTQADCIVTDPVLGRKMKVSKSGSSTTVIWNPWIEKSKTMPDLTDGDYKTMVCVETAQAHDDIAIIKPGGKHTMSTEISVSRQ